MKHARGFHRAIRWPAWGHSTGAAHPREVRLCRHHRARLLVCIALGVVLSGCLGRIPEPSAFPDADIVFQFTPVGRYKDTQMLGFVNADGTGFAELELIEKSGAIPTWSSDGRWILYRWWPPGDPSRSRAYLAVGGFRVCQKTDLWGVGRPHPVPYRGNLVLTSIDWTGGVRDKPTISLVDPLTCEIVEDLYQHELVGSGGAGDTLLMYPTLSVDGLLAVGLWTSGGTTSDSDTRILIVDLATGDETEVGTGVGMAWSPDGEWLAYAQPYGIMIVRSDGTEARRVMAERFIHQRVPYLSGGTVWRDWPPYPEWSPDGKWLAFHLWDGHQFNIYKLNVETEELQLIIKNGVYPHWRWPEESDTELP